MKKLEKIKKSIDLSQSSGKITKRGLNQNLFTPNPNTFNSMIKIKSKNGGIMIVKMKAAKKQTTINNFRGYY